MALAAWTENRRFNNLNDNQCISMCLIMLSTVTNCLVLPRSGDDYVQTGFDCVHSEEFVAVVVYTVHCADSCSICAVPSSIVFSRKELFSLS